MNLHYISGFFDADGSITIASNNKKEFKSPQISFSNTKLIILKEIQLFLLNNYNLKSYISIKQPRFKNHNVAYDLKFKGNHAKLLSNLLTSYHPVKQHRINCVNKYYNKVTKRNGKYNEKELKSKLAFERLFFFNFNFH